ncbi:GH36 C-terminal domain-containing protein [Streptomyces sp. M10(2022)]
MSATYMNIGRMTGRMEDYYSYMAVRAVKFGQDPGDATKWPDAAVRLMSVFNAWRRRPEITALTDGQFLPVHLGEGWDTTEWDSSRGPYVWMYADDRRRTALVIATAAGTVDTTVDAKLRWLDPHARYTVTDVTIDDDGTQSDRTIGTFSGDRLRTTGLPVDLGENASKGKAFWLRAAGH